VKLSLQKNNPIIIKNNLVSRYNDHWQITNDSVMGGLSHSKIVSYNEKVIYSGNVSIENNGGFTSVFTSIEKLDKQWQYVSIRFLGDGNLYQLRVRSQVMGYELAYKIALKTQANVEQNLRFKLSDFEACFRGRQINQAPPLIAEVITHVGILISSKQPLDFTLALYSIEFS